MSRRSILIALAVIAMPVVGQISPAYSNGPELYNGDDGIVYYFGCPSIGNVPGSVPPIVNLTSADQRFFVILPRELMNSSNNTPPNPANMAVPPGYPATSGTMEFVGQQVAIFHTWWASGVFPLMYDQTFETVVYSTAPLPFPGSFPTPDPSSSRFPNYGAVGSGSPNAFLTISGGPIALPPPPGIPTTGCTAAAGIYGYIVQIDYAYTALGGAGPPGIFIPADNNTDIAVTLWVPGGMVFPSSGTCLPGTPDPSLCELGGDYTFMALASTCAAPGCTFPSTTVNHEHVAAGLTPTNRNPYGGWVGGGGVVNNWARSDSWMNQIGFREPFVEFRYNPYNAGVGAYWGPERGAGAMNMDATGLGQVDPGMRMQCTPCVGNTVVYVLSCDPVNFSLSSQPGTQIFPYPAWLLLNLADPCLLLVTPALDTVAVNNTIDYAVDKHTADTPLSFTFFGPWGPPSLFTIQGFIIDFSSGNVRSSNTARFDLR